MRIALFHNLPSGGARRHTYEQVRELARRGHEVTEFAPSTANLAFCSLAPYVKQQRIFELTPVDHMQRRIPLLTPYVHAIQGIMTLRRTQQLNQAIAREIDGESFDLAFVKDCRIMPSPYLLRYLATPSVFQCHHVQRLSTDHQHNGDPNHLSLSERFKRAYYAPARFLFRYVYTQDEAHNIQMASQVLTNSEYSQKTLAERYGIRSHVVYPGINAQIFQPQPDARGHYVLSVGSLNYFKGYRFLVSALARIDATRRLRLFIAANARDPDEEKVVREMAAQLGVELCIEKIVDDRRLVQVYNQAQVFVYAPLQEALGMAPLEAMACGTPVVAVGEGGVRETVLDGVTGWLVDRDADAFAERLQSLLGDDQARIRMGQAGVDYVRSKWTWRRAVDRLEHRFRGVNAVHPDAVT